MQMFDLKNIIIALNLATGELSDDVSQHSISMKILFPTLFRGKDFVLFSAFFRY